MMAPRLMRDGTSRRRLPHPNSLGLWFDKIPVITDSPQGFQNTRWVDTGVPRIHPNFASCVFYLYKSMEDARAGSNAGGTGFFVAMPTDDLLGHHYGVTNWHVAVRDGFSVIRLNTSDGGVAFIDLDSSDWVFRQGGDDIAVVPLSIRDPSHKAFFLGSQFFLKEEDAAAIEFGPGDDVFMAGRFVDVDDQGENIPFLRFGHVSSPPIRCKQPTGYADGRCYCIDMHSRSGFSGSPVFGYRTPGSDLSWVVTREPVALGGSTCFLLGIHWGQFQENLRMESGGDGTTVRGASGMTLVIPAWKIMDVLNTPSLALAREQEEARRRGLDRRRVVPVAESHDGPGDDVAAAGFDDTLRAMLASPPSPHGSQGRAKRSRKDRS